MTKIIAQAPQTGCASYITPGKRYEVEDCAIHSIPGFYITDDTGKLHWSMWERSSHLSGGNWLRIEEADTTDASDGEALKPCPFCAGPARDASHSSCDCCGKAFNGQVMCAAGCGAEVSHYDSAELAAAAWNRRALSTPKVPEELKALADAPKGSECRQFFRNACERFVRTLIADQKGEEAGRG